MITHPEARYHTATPTQRKRIQSAVVRHYRPKVEAIVRSSPLLKKYHDEAEQVGCIGVLAALAMYKPSARISFWTFASRQVRFEIRRWLDRGVYWRPRWGDQLLPEAEIKARLRYWMAKIPAKDVRLLVSEGARKHISRSASRYRALLKRAAAATSR